jgi:hypothetical protein
MMPRQSSTDAPMAEEISSLAATIAAAEARAAAGNQVDLAALALLIDDLTSRAASASPDARLAARTALLALLEGAASLVDTLDRRSGEMRSQLHGLRRGHAAGRAYGASSRLRR